jgi:enoyl-CoA hydratase/carnithine racemase
MDEADEETFRAWILGPLFQMTSLMLHEKRAHLSHMNAIGELCAQFRQGVLAQMRRMGPEEPIRIVEAYHRLHPEAAAKSWYPDVFAAMKEADWQQLYVNAEHEGNVGVITISRESYNSDVDAELNRAIDWLKGQGIDAVILTGDFHMSTQMVGADTSEFYPALEDPDVGRKISGGWSETARRLHKEFRVSVGVLNGKRCLGGMMELMLHCHFVLSVEDGQFGFPEVTLPVVPGMEGCHWPFRKATPDHWPKIVEMLLTGRSVKAPEAVGWLIDFAGPIDAVLQTAWKIASGADTGVARRPLEEGARKEVPQEIPDLPAAGSAATEAARKAILDCARESCRVSLADALGTQSWHSAEFMKSETCRRGAVGAEYAKTMKI